MVVVFGLGSQISKSFSKTGISNSLDGTQDDVLWDETDSGGFVLTLININVSKKGGHTIYKGIEFCTKFGVLNQGGCTIQGTHCTQGPTVNIY